MASKQTEELNNLYREWVAALKANPEMPLDELRHMLRADPVGEAMDRSIPFRHDTGEAGGPRKKLLCAAISEACVCSRKRLRCSGRQLATLPGLRLGRCLARRDGYRPLLIYCSATVLFLWRMVNS
jgi:hypothetical protein